MNGGQAPAVYEPGSLAMVGVVTLAALGASVLLGLALAAFVRRRSQPYVLIVGAIAALLGRSAVAGLSLAGVLRPGPHHFLEHGLDVVMVALIVAAVYHARTVTGDAEVGQ